MVVLEELREGVLIIHVYEKRLDASRASALKNELFSRIEGGHKIIVLDLHEVDFMDSIGLGTIVSGLKRMRPNGDLMLAGAKGSVAKVLGITQMNRVFRVHDSVDSAIESTRGMVE